MTDPTPLADAVRALDLGSPLAAALARVADETPEQRAAAYLADHREALAEQATARARYRRARYEDARPPEYAHADLTRLHPQQDPGGRGTGWLRSNAKNALLMGPSGHGKTHLAYAIANAAVQAGLWVEAWSVLELVQTLAPLPRHARDDEVRSRRQENTLDWAKTCDLLILDDLGAEEATGYAADRWRAQLLDILTARDGHPRRRTIVTVNGGATAGLAPEQAAQVRRDAAAMIAARYSARVATRLQRGCLGIWVEGECLRKAQVWDPFEERP
ncbi:ATP-binding protein [Thermomonospora cellulosilytica]|uniref:DNA replication protein DnaC n=1 Tax=Thermomonospora cellulosilytica TaxID=1411118 RepID=A0A7W3MXD0_9ACTN|nr:ATP-binding protein [Thermomonospora cellulosilytica]MBA9003684.1 DNA replication protein DnaC [Thermomonospora cellulosilytica]